VWVRLSRKFGESLKKRRAKRGKKKIALKTKKEKRWRSLKKKKEGGKSARAKYGKIS